MNTTKKLLLWRLGAALAANFFVLPVAEFIGARHARARQPRARAGALTAVCRVAEPRPTTPSPPPPPTHLARALAGAVTPAWERTRIVTGFDLFFVLVINVALLWVLWPSRAADAFRVYDGSVAAAMLGDGSLLGGAGASGAGFTAALDEAYAYTAASDPYSEYSGSL